MANAIVVGLIGLAAASAFAALGRQFQRYSQGKSSYIGKLEHRYILTAIIVALLTAVGSALFTFFRNGSTYMFLWVFGAFIGWEALLFVFFFVRSRR